MKEIKFRAYRKSTQNTCDVLAIDFEKGLVLLDDGDEEDISTVELMQYTGLKDKNGKAVYEGDILKCDRPAYHQNHKFVVKDWVLLHDVPVKVFGASLWSNGNDVEVMGNIYEDPNLLEEQDD